MRICGKCGTKLTQASPGGLCPKCFLLEGLTPADAESPDSREPLNGGEVPPSPAAAPATPSGAKVRYFGDYELLEEIAHGGMGMIYKARQVSLNRIVAVKMILSGLLAGEKEVKRFHAEAEAAANLDHPNIVSIYEVGQHEGQHYFSMRFIEGRDLAAQPEGGGSKMEDGVTPPSSMLHAPSSAALCRDAVMLLVKVVRAVHYAHQRGILHRDLKPANILIDAHGEPHIADFELARRTTGDGDLTLSGARMGTPHFASPEQVAGKTRQLTTATDIYSLGAILYFLLAWRPPFQGDSALQLLRMVEEQEAERPGKFNPGVDRDLDTICLKCLEKDPQRRYASADALADDLERWLRHDPIMARPASRPEKLWLWCRRKPAIAGMAGAALLAVAIVSGLAAWRLTVARQQRELEQYAANISRADTAISVGSMDRELDYLIKCPERLRHWEWGRRLFECMQEVSSIPAHTNRPQFLTSLLAGVAAVCVRRFEPEILGQTALTERRYSS